MTESMQSDCANYKLENFLPTDKPWGDIPLDFKISTLAHKEWKRGRPNKNPFIQSTASSNYPPSIPDSFAHATRVQLEELAKKSRKSIIISIDNDSVIENNDDATTDPTTIANTNTISSMTEDQLCDDTTTTNTITQETQEAEDKSSSSSSDSDSDDDEDEDEQDESNQTITSPSTTASTAPIAPKPTKVEEKTLSKKELKAKELAELDALLAAELGDIKKVEAKTQVPEVSEVVQDTKPEEEKVDVASEAALAFLGGGGGTTVKKKPKKKKKKTSAGTSTGAATTTTQKKVKKKLSAAEIASKTRKKDKKKKKNKR